MGICVVSGCPEFAAERGRCSHHQLTGEGDTSWGKRRDRTEQARFRRRMLEAFQGQCAAIVAGQRCQAREDLEAHHLPDGSGVLLCNEHHVMLDPHARRRKAKKT